MAVFLKQSTAVNIALGPFVDSTDAVTPEDSLTISQSDVRLKKNDGNWAQKSDATAATHEENGWYEVPLGTGDTDTLGTLIVAVNESGALPVWREFQVVPGPVYDALVAGSQYLFADVVTMQPGAIDAIWSADTRTLTANSNLGGLQVNVTQIDGDTGSADVLGKATNGTGGVSFSAGIYVDTMSPTSLSQIADAVGDTGAVSNAVWSSLTSAHVDTGTFGEALAEGVPAVVDTGVFQSSAIAAAVWNELRTSHTDTGTFGEHLGGTLAATSADTGAIANAVWAKDSRMLTDFSDTGLNDRLARIQADTDTGLRSYITAAVPTANITAIKVQTDKLTFDTGNELQVDIRKVNNITVTGTGDTGAGGTWRPET